ncbi:hypothetical protein F7725_020603 [Dissostichus mawsoni]|uniref:ADF-H domain-containing protein n=1 Tax=Dissostichus mawsoni TaxID=36200 RepID=A0A7J5YDR2_DISMA|nr:hypothetical protein F7725_020603 [Dissostichus mawsoni]
MGEDIPPGKGMCPFWPAGDVLDEGDWSCQAWPGSRDSAELGHSSEPWRGISPTPHSGVVFATVLGSPQTGPRGPHMVHVQNELQTAASSRGFKQAMLKNSESSCQFVTSLPFSTSPSEYRKAGKNPLRMSSSLVVCEVDESLKEKLKKLRFRKETSNAAILMKIDMVKQHLQICPADGRVSYPLCFIFSSPMGCKPEQQMMYAGSKNRLVQVAELTKVFETRNADDLTEEWLKNQLSFFK